MDLAVTPAYQADFYRRAFQSVTGAKGAPRVLISGTADYSMLAHVLTSFRERGLDPAVTVVDICETPLRLNRWYAERESARIKCNCGDILGYADGTRFDAVCSDSFLGQFPLEGRIQLLAKWRQLLRPGGAVITVTRVRATAGAERIGFSTEKAQAFRASVAHKTASIQPLLCEDPVDMARAAELYVNRQQTWPVRSREEIQQMFEHCGFRVDELSDAPHAAGDQRQPKEPSSPGSGDQVRIIATRL